MYVNLFLPSVYDWKEKGVELTMESPFPSQSCSIRVQVTGDGAAPSSGQVPLKLKVRIPYWCREAFRILVNGQALPGAAPGEGYYPLERSFGDGDIITVETPYSLHLCYTEDPYEGYPAASVMYGPLVMTALSGATDWIRLNLPPALEDAFAIGWEEGMPVLWYDDLKFVPSYAARNAAYHTYFQICLS